MEERVSTVGPLERELTVDHVPMHAATQSVTETHDFRVEFGGKVAVLSPNTLLVGVWTKL